MFMRCCSSWISCQLASGNFITNYFISFLVFFFSSKFTLTRMNLPVQTCLGVSEDLCPCKAGPVMWRQSCLWLAFPDPSGQDSAACVSLPYWWLLRGWWIQPCGQEVTQMGIPWICPSGMWSCSPSFGLWSCCRDVNSPSLLLLNAFLDLTTQP